MARQFITGDAELERKLKGLKDKAADRIAKAALGAGLTVIRSAMRKAAPKGKTKLLRDSIGKRLERDRKTGVVTAKVGVNVGKKSASSKRAPHGHLVALGTQKRTRRKIGGRFSYITNPKPEQLTTGTGPTNDFARRSSEAAQPAVRTKMRTSAQRALAKYIAKLNKGTSRGK